MGVRFTCKLCEGSFDFCAGCEKEFYHPHPLVKLTEPVDIKNIKKPLTDRQVEYDLKKAMIISKDIGVVNC
jgi:hypothetical protein